MFFYVNYVIIYYKFFLFSQPAPFTEQEDTDIVKHIVKYRRERNVLGNKLWKHMEKAGVRY